MLLAAAHYLWKAGADRIVVTANVGVDFAISCGEKRRIDAAVRCFIIARHAIVFDAMYLDLIIAFAEARFSAAHSADLRNGRKSEVA